MKKIIHVNNTMPAQWNSKVTFVLVSQFLGLAFCYPSGSVSGSFITPCLIVSLGGRKKGKKRGKKRNKPPADFNTVQVVLLVFLDPQEEGGWDLVLLTSNDF